jgi:Diacylglycerol kinase catalytic domain
VKRALLIVNTLSGNAAAADLDEIKRALSSAGLLIEHVVQLPDSDCPNRKGIENMGVDAVVLLSGDGTVASVCAELRGWSGELLVLPGGTMNLLSRRLHGDIDLTGLLETIAGGKLQGTKIPIVREGTREILTGLTVGPSTRWGEVREGIRQGDVSSLTQTVPEAWAETLSNEGVWIEGIARHPYAAIFVEPNDETALSVIAFRANNIGDMLGHGIAWLRRDFREGPKDELGVMPTVVVIGDDHDTGLLVDGEYEDGQLPLTCHAGLSTLKFLKIA